MLKYKSEVIATDKDNRKVKDIARGDIFAIRLESQPGTGYTWLLDKFDQNRLEFLNESTVTDSGIPGGTNLQVFRFKAAQTGNAYVQLKYVRPWEKEEIPVKLFEVKLNIMSKT